MNSILKGKTAAYLSFIMATIAVAANVMGIIGTEIMLTALGLFGFAGIAGFRAFINSTGFKTYILSGLGIIGIVAFNLGYIDQSMLQNWLALFGMLAGGSLTQGVAKAQQ